MGTRIGMIGLGRMGSAIAANLVRAGFDVLGYDVVPERVAALVSVGGSAAGSSRDVAQGTDIVLTFLPSAAALDHVLEGEEGILAEARPGFILVEASTLALDAKFKARQRLERLGAVALDCPLSGTGAQAVTRDIAVYASGDPNGYDRCFEVFAGFARASYYIGEFGLGSKMKYVANLLVAIHNLAAAEALVLATKAGLPPDEVIEVLAAGAGTSRMLEVRGPQMVRGDFDTVSMSLELFQKDLSIIGAFARDLDCPVPLFSTASRYYLATMAQGRGAQDTAAVYAVLARFAGLTSDNSDDQTGPWNSPL